MTTAECDHHKKKRAKRIKICYSIIGFIFIVVVVCAITWLILHPRNPRFIIRDATFYNFSVNSSPDLFTSNFQITIDSRNPNGIFGIYYQNLYAYATYRDQQISFYTSIPPTYQGHKDSNIWSPFIEGTNIPISQLNANALHQDQASGTIPIMIRINGQARWKLGSIIFRRHHLHVTCPANIPYGSESQDSLVVGTSIKYELSVNCQVS